MVKFFLILLSFFSLRSTHAQPSLKTFVEKSAVAIPTIDPDSTDYSDLEKIGEAIGSARIVMLGEQDHGDAPTFLAKTRLIKYLHEKKGFNVLAFESDFFGLNYGWELLNKEQSAIENFIKKNIFPIWTYCSSCSNLFYQYIPGTYKTSNPLTLTGFDNQMILNYSHENLVAKLDSVFTLLDLPITRQANYRSDVIPTIDSLKLGYSRKLSADFYVRCGSYLDEIRKQAKQRIQHDDFWLLVIDNLVQENTEYKLRETQFTDARNARDYQMAQNLKWISQVKYPNEKIIVWAANMHVSKYPDKVSANNKQLIAMGNYFTRNSVQMNETYILGFTSYQGRAGRLGSKIFSIKEPKSNGFENWINSSYKYAFVDFKGYNKQFPSQSAQFYLKGLGHQSFFKYDWTKVFDGIFYIKDMYPCEDFFKQR